MDGVSAAASIIALVEMSVKVLSLTAEYSAQVKNAKKDIDRFHLELEAFIKVLRSLHELAENTEVTELETFRSLTRSFQQCKLDLEHLQMRLEPGKGQKAMSRYGLRASKWPFERKELYNLIGILERYKSTFSTALNADQTSLLLESRVKLDLAKQDRCLSKLSYASGANFDSSERQNEAYCLPDTRVEILSHIMEWSAHPRQKSIFWLNGMAGTGKSTIARTIARILTKQKRLAASFFFSRGRGDLSNTGKLFSTIAIQLAATSTKLKRYICKAIAEHENVDRQSLREQWTNLIYQPLTRVRSKSKSPLVLVLVFDALDECGRQEDIRTLLRLLAETKNLEAVKLRVLVTSRPEIPIQLGFRAISGDTHENFVLHNIASPVIQHDISVFLRHEMGIIRSEHLLPSDWPTKEELELLVEKSGGLFIYAVTVCRFIHDHRWLPAKRLKIVLEGGSHEQSPERRLDEMYIQILENSIFQNDCNEKEKDLLSRRFQNIVGSIIVLLDSLSVVSLMSLFPMLSETIEITLAPLKSLLDVPVNRDTPVRLLHPSFRDFLLNQERCQARSFWIDQRKAHHDVAEQCLNLMSKALKKNICRLETPGTPRSGIDSTVLNLLLPPQLQYACQYWVSHLQKGVPSVDDAAQVHVFLQTHFLHWLGALSLMGKITEGVRLVNILESIQEFQSNTDIITFVKDARRFILEFKYIIDTAPLQLYNSALIFSPEASVVKNVYSDQTPSWIESLPEVEENWTSSLQALEGHSDWVNVVAFSPDGQLLASGSNDDSVKLWDPITGDLLRTLTQSSSVHVMAFSLNGQLLACGQSKTLAHSVKLWDPISGDPRGTLESHEHLINSIVFSPDGQLLASGSSDSTVKLWDPVTGDLLATNRGHSSNVNKLAFSPDGRLLASGSDDETVGLWDLVEKTSRRIRGHSREVSNVAFSPDGQLLLSSAYENSYLWDPISGELRATLEGCQKPTVFSPNGQLLASGSKGEALKLWDPVTGDLLRTLTGHLHYVLKVVFSPDSQLVASCSNDRTVKLWDPVTGVLQATLRGHSEFISTVIFSPSGHSLASGSWDMTVRLWESVRRGKSRDTFEGHWSKVSAVAFSHDGQQLVSVSADSTVRLWNPVTGNLLSTLRGHSGYIWTVVYSPDSRMLASGSGDKTVKLWDPVTRDLLNTLEGHLNEISAVAFSPDSKLLASGSKDCTVKLWDPVTGLLRGTLGGHSREVTTVAFSPDGQLLASGARDKTVRLWDPVTRNLMGVLEGHSDWVWEVAFSPNSQLLAAECEDNTIWLWLVEEKKLLQLIQHEEGEDLIFRNSRNLAFSTDGSQLLLDGKLIDFNIPNSLTPSRQKRASTEKLYSLNIQKDWVTWNNRRVLWLPRNRRPGVYAIKNNIVAIGNGSGRLTFFSYGTM